ncbi:MAG: hypothetical protein ABI370_00505, partial [Gammaproteobacteria bacterium]
FHPNSHPLIQLLSILERSVLKLFDFGIFLRLALMRTSRGTTAEGEVLLLYQPHSSRCRRPAACPRDPVNLASV